MTQQELIVAFLKALPNGRTCYPMDLIVDKMGTNVEINLKLKLKTIKPIDISREKDYSDFKFEIKV